VPLLFSSRSAERHRRVRASRQPAGLPAGSPASVRVRRLRGAPRLHAASTDAADLQRPALVRLPSRAWSRLPLHENGT